MYFHAEMYLGTDGGTAALKESAMGSEKTAAAVAFVRCRDVVLLGLQRTSFNVFEIDRTKEPRVENLLKKKDS